VIHTTLVGLEPTTLRSLVRLATSSATEPTIHSTFPQNLCWENFVNCLTFAEVMIKHQGPSFLLTHSVAFILDDLPTLSTGIFAAFYKFLTLNLNAFSCFSSLISFCEVLKLVINCICDNSGVTRAWLQSLAVTVSKLHVY